MPVARRTRRRGWIKPSTRPVQRERHRDDVRTRAVDRIGSAPAWVLDVEGTLIDTVLPSLSCWCGVLRRHGHDLRTADMLRFAGLGVEETLRHLIGGDDRADLREAVSREYRERYVAEVLAVARPVIGARSLLPLLKRRGATVGVVSIGGEDDLVRHLAALGAEGHVDVAVSTVDHHGSTIEAAALRVAAAAQVDVRDIRYVGDSPNDVSAARALGLTTVGVLTGHVSRADLSAAGCRFVFRDAAELASALRESDETSVAEVAA